MVYAGYKRSDFSWSHSDSVNFSKKGSPWDQLNKLTLDASFNGALGESVNWFAGGSIIPALKIRSGTRLRSRLAAA